MILQAGNVLKALDGAPEEFDPLIRYDSRRRK
jgi:hypothetical protein